MCKKDAYMPRAEHTYRPVRKEGYAFSEELAQRLGQQIDVPDLKMSQVLRNPTACYDAKNGIVK